MKIAFVTISDPADLKAWSGIINKIYNLLIVRYGNDNIHKIGSIPSFGVVSIMRICNFLIKTIFNRSYNYSHSFILSYIYSSVAQVRLKKIADLDLILFVGSTSSLAFLKVPNSIRIIHYTDATFESLNGYYLKNLLPFSIWESNFIESKALNRCHHIIFSSDWSMNEAREYYNLKCDMSVIKFGSNLTDNIGFLKNSIEKAEHNILFVGVDWQRKGGDIVLAAFQDLVSKGYRVKLTIVGCVPPYLVSNDVRVYPFLNKNDHLDLELLENIYANSDIFILPTRAECSAIVYAEAAQFGLPIITTNTGGTSNYVDDKINGFTLELSAPAETYTTRLIQLIEDRELYRRFSNASLEKYRSELNWQKCGENLFSLFELN